MDKKKDRTRMYCHPSFKKMVDLRRIEYGDQDTINFTKKLANNPGLLKGIEKEIKNDAKKKKRVPSLF